MPAALARDLERAVAVVAELFRVPDGRAARSVLGGARPYAVEPVDRVAGDEQVPPGPVAQRIHRLAHVAGDIPADVNDGIPATGAERRIVAGVPVADQPRQAREQVRPGLPPAEHGHLGPDHAELKSMHTAEAARGRGIGRAMLTHLLGVARTRGVRRVSLETGTTTAFAAARALYHGAGFTSCGPFAGYRPSEDNLFMTLDLGPLRRPGS